jgi:aconitate hydratase
MDARSIAATAKNGGVLTAADELDWVPEDKPMEQMEYDDSAYRARVYYGVGKPQPEAELVYGPNITDWPAQIALTEDLLIEVASAIYDPVTTTDELIPSGDTSSYRSNPLRLAEFTLSRKDPAYVGRAKAIQQVEKLRQENPNAPEVKAFLGGLDASRTGIGSAVMARKPGDGSAREQAASCQRVLGGVANLVGDFATKRYRSNVVNWGMLPFVVPNIEALNIQPGDKLHIVGIRALLEGEGSEITATLIQGGERKEITLTLPNLTREERDVILTGCLMNYYASPLS